MFRTHLKLDAAAPPGLWVLDAPLVWDDGTERITVPQGFLTDLASIPRIFRTVLSQNGLSRRPATLHDFLYRTQPMPRADADALFRRALASEGMGAFGCFTYWAGVRAGGWIAWNSRRDDARK